jgi:Arc/MetJ-type ribon-helix-helix transcriptional regulator
MSLFTIPRPAERAAWLRERHPYFGASAAGALYGVHPHLDLADVVAEKMAPEPTDNGETEAMERGTRLEPVLLEWFGDRHGVKVVPSDVLYANGRLMATLDGEIVGDSESWVEAKTTRDTWDDVPPHVYWQVVAQAAASGKRGQCFVVWFDAELRLKEAAVVPAKQHVADVLDRVERFMSFLDLGMVPEGVEMTAEHLAVMFPAPEVGKWVDLDDVGRDAVVEWETARQERIAAEKRERAAKDAVANLLTDAEGGRFNGLPVVTWKANRPSERFSSKAHAQGAPDCHAAHTVMTPGARVLRSTKHLGEAL